MGANQYNGLFAFTVQAILVLLIFPLVNSSSETLKHLSSHESKKDYSRKADTNLHFEIVVHGLLLWVALGFLMPVGVLEIRMSNIEDCGRRNRLIFYVHAVIQMLAVLLTTVGAIMSINNFSNSFNNNHQRLGVALYGFVWLQLLVGFFRPLRGSKGRSLWFLVHWMIGSAVSLLGILNIYTGLQAYHEKTSRSIRIWTIIFTAQISVFVCLYLLQDKWVYIKKQGLALITNETPRPTLQEIYVDSKQLDVKVGSC